MSLLPVQPAIFAMFSYHKVVYGLKHGHPLNKSMLLTKLLRRHNVIVFEHDGEDEDICGRPFLHYHCIFEHRGDFSFENDGGINAIKDLCCYFKSGYCHNPVEYIAILSRLSMKHALTTIYAPSNLKRFEEESFRRLDVLPSDHNLMTFKRRIIPDEDVFTPNSWNCDMSINTALNSTIVNLCTAFILKDTSADLYLSPEESSLYVVEWCIAQNIHPELFVEDWIKCLDRKGDQKNALYFQGQADSSATHIVNSIMDACGQFSCKVLQDTTGYSYFWNKCVGKIMITLINPHFDAYNCCEMLLEIFKGSGSHVKMLNDGFFMYMEPTPVVVIAREHGWQGNRQLEMDIKDRLINNYNNLISFRQPCKKLHPLWLPILDARCRIFPNEYDAN